MALSKNDRRDRIRFRIRKTVSGTAQHPRLAVFISNTEIYAQLIDDVSGELDERRWKNLISYLQAKSFQVLITTANENFKKELEKIEEAKKVFLKDGYIN